MSRVSFCSPWIQSKEKRLSFFLFFTDDAIEVVLAEAITSTTDTTLTPTSCCAPPPPFPGSLDPLAKCTKLETLNLYYCSSLEGT